MSDSRKIKVTIGDLAVGSSPYVISTYGLGSCVAVMLYDPVTKIGGMNHFLLPTNTPNRVEKNLAKFSDTGIKMLIEKLMMLGAKEERIIAKLVGGANMFPMLNKSSIGQKNIEAALKILGKYSINIVSQDTGGNWGRSVDFDLSNGNVIVKSYKTGVKKI
mgnify:CR=1 FL=1